MQERKGAGACLWWDGGAGGGGEGVVVIPEGGPGSGCAPRSLGTARTQALPAEELPYANMGSCMLCVLAQ